MRSRREPIPSLAPLGRLYLAGSGLRNALFDRGLWRAQAAGIPVLSIGNIVAGGTGKTPAALWFARLLGAEERRVAIVSRGHGGRRERDPILVRRDDAILAPVQEAGDEPYLMAQDGAAPIVAVGRDRVAAAALAREAGADAIVLDDGFQHRWLARDLDVVLLDARDPLGGGRGLPAGLLREPAVGLARAGLLLLTRAPREWLVPHLIDARALPGPVLDALRRARAPLPPVAAAAHRPSRVTLADGSSSDPTWLEGRDVVAVSGIARPGSFVATLEALGAQVLERFDFPDHHRFAAADLAPVVEASRRRGDAPVVITAKDATRWPPGGPAAVVLHVVLDLPAADEVRAIVRRSLFGTVA